MRCIVEGKIFDTDSAQLILTYRDLQNQFQYFMTAKRNFVGVMSPAPEFEAASYMATTAFTVPEDEMKTILGMYDLSKYEEIFGTENLETL